MSEDYRETEKVKFYSFDTIVIGSGSAAFNAADWLHDLGRKKIAVVTEGIHMGTSRNAGSDKQTYYKLTLAGSRPDSVHEMARDLFAGGGVDGDHALIEAANSAKAFLKLALSGVPFPVNACGEYVGYRTDHDAGQRATSAGPLTSRYITECLERSVKRKGITILDRMLVFEIVTDQDRAAGVLCIDKESNGNGQIGLCGIYAKQIIVATGGPAGCYQDSVYPCSHTGMSGMLFEAGARGANLNCWQYGLASVRFRWNVSGTYQQALPRYFSVDGQGKEYAFLEAYYQDACRAADMVFLKGYQWPFDPRLTEGSSRIDLLVWHQTAVLGRRVFLDFRKDPKGVEQGFVGLSREAYAYLENSDALLPTPVARLERMNPQAVALYRAHGIDLYREPLEVRVCAQHHNGGAEVDTDYQTCIQGLYVVGEAAGIYGPRRPGGAALNSCQVGAMRAAQHIAREREDASVTGRQKETMRLALEEWTDRIRRRAGSLDRERLLEQRAYFAEKMSRYAAHVRNREEMERLFGEIGTCIASMEERLQSRTYEDLPVEIRNRDIFITQRMVLSAMLEEAGNGGVEAAERVISAYGDGRCVSHRRPVRALREPDCWFESVWRTYRENGVSREKGESI